MMKKLFFFSLVEEYYRLWDIFSDDYNKTNLKNGVWEMIVKQMMECYHLYEVIFSFV